MLLLFLFYAGSALLLGVLGVHSYSRTVTVLQEGFSERSGILYIAQKVQQGDIAGGVRLDRYQDNDALVLIEQETGQGFEDWIFIQDGYLCELLISSGDEVNPAQAQRIMPMKALVISLSANNLLSVSVTTEADTVNSISLALRSSGGAFNTGTTPAPAASTAESGGPTVMTPPSSQTIQSEQTAQPTQTDQLTQTTQGGAG